MFADNQSQQSSPNFQTIQNSPKRKKRRSNTTYKHVPHSAKPVQVVAKRNARERKRVQNVNSAFTYLRRHIPYENRHKRLSKVKTLRIAIDYIQSLQSLISEHDQNLPSKENSTENWKNMEANNTVLSTFFKLWNESLKFSFIIYSHQHLFTKYHHLPI